MLQVTWHMFWQYIQAFGPTNMVFLLVFNTLYYITFINANMLLVHWTNDGILMNSSDSAVDRSTMVWSRNYYSISMYSLHGLALGELDYVIQWVIFT